MSNYPDSTGEHDPRAPWNEPTDERVRCAECDALLDERAVDEGCFQGTGWQGELCSRCANAGECACDDRGHCSPRCSDRYHAELESDRLVIQRMLPTVHPLALSDPAEFQRLCKDDPGELYYGDRRNG